MKNQDPLNPLDNAAITSQMAQLSTVSGIEQLNSTLQALSNSMAVGQSVSATSMIGHGVLVPGSNLSLTGGVAVGGMELTQPADSVSVTIKDASGNIVSTLQFGAQDAGVLPFSWNGLNDAGTPAPDGNYTFSVEATLAGSTMAPATLEYGLVNAVTPGAQGSTTLDVGQWGGFDLSEVKQVL
jgi:flagellar basal-body rod modification protein FlgD